VWLKFVAAFLLFTLLVLWLWSRTATEPDKSNSSSLNEHPMLSEARLL
jgi:hypothetical protein